MKILLVEDEGQPASLTGQALEREYGHAVTVTVDFGQAKDHLTKEDFDVVVVDLFSTPLLIEFERRKLAARVTPLSDTLLFSGLSVITTARSNQSQAGVVVWTNGDPTRRLHLIFAYEDLHVRSYCSKRIGLPDEPLKPLQRAINAAASQQAYRDSVLLGAYLPSPKAIPLRSTILRNPRHRLIWRALALGYHSSAEIADVIGGKEKTIRNAMGDMLVDLLSFDQGTDSRKPQTELISFATSNRYFFLDDAVRELYP